MHDLKADILGEMEKLIRQKLMVGLKAEVKRAYRDALRRATDDVRENAIVESRVATERTRDDSTLS